MPTASSARLLAAGLAGGNDSKAFKSPNSSSMMAGTSHAAEPAGSLRSNAVKSKTWGGSPAVSLGTGALPSSLGGATHHKVAGALGSSSRLGASSFLIPAKVTTTTSPFDSISSSSSGSQGRSSSLLRGSSAATFDAAAHGLTRSLSSSSHGRTATAAVSSSRSSSTGRVRRPDGACSPGSQPVRTAASPGRGVSSSGGPTLRALSTADGSNSHVAVPGRPRVLVGSSTALDSARAGISRERLGTEQWASSGPLHSSRSNVKAAAAAVLRTTPSGSSSSSSSSSSALHRSASLGATGLLGSSKREGQQPPLFESHHSPRPPDAAARPKPASSSTTAAHAPAHEAATACFGGPTPCAGSSSYLARLHTQRAATADAVSSSLGGSGMGSSSTAGRRVSSASTASSLSACRGSSSSSTSEIHGALQRRPRPVSSDAVAAAGSVGSGSTLTAGTSGPSSIAGTGVQSRSRTNAAMPEPSAAATGPNQTLSHSSSVCHDLQSQQQGDWLVERPTCKHAQQPEQSAHSVLAELLDKCNKHKLQNLAAAQSSCQEQQSSGRGLQPGHKPSAADSTCGPGEQLEFPSLQQPQPPQQQPQRQPPVSRTGSYLDIIRRSSSGSGADRQPGQPQPQRELPQQQQQQQQLAGQARQRPLQYHAQLYQQQQYNPAQFQQQQRGPESLGVSAGGTGATSKPSSNNSSRRSSADLERTAEYRPLAAGLAAVASGSTGGGTGGVYRPPYAPPGAAAGSSGSSSCSLQAPGVHCSGVTGAMNGRLYSTGSDYYTASSDAGDSDHARSSSSGGGAAVQHDQQPLHTRLQQQSQPLQEQLLATAAREPAQPQPSHMPLHNLHSGHGGLQQHQQQQQDGDLISTQPMSGQGCEPEAGVSDVCSPQADFAAAAADVAARQAFFNTPLSSAGSDDLQAAAAAAMAGDASAQPSYGKAGPSSSAQRDRGWAGSGASGSSSAAAGARNAGDVDDPWQPLPRRRVDVVVEREADAHDTSDSETDVSEMSSSLDGNDSDSDASVDIVVQSHKQAAAGAAAGAVGAAAAGYPDGVISSSAARQAQHPGPAESFPAGVPQRSTGLRKSRFAGSPASTPVTSGAAAAAAQSPVVRQQNRSVALSPSGLPRGCCGIRNQGNTCYQNSCVQLLGCVPELVGALLGPQAASLLQAAAADAANNRTKASVQHALAAAARAAQAGIVWRPKAVVGPALQALLCEMWGFQQQQQQQQQGSPSRQQAVQLQQQHQQQLLRRVTDCMAALREAMAETDPRWDDGDQWDCQEFCLALLQTVHNESNRVRGKPQYRELKLQGTEAQQAAEAAAYARSWEDSVVLDIFSWQLQSSITCGSCMRCSHVFDSSQELLVPIPQGCVDVTVQECLARTIFSPEKMAGAEGYKCEHCKGLQEATKQLQLFSYPQVLLLGLKRFETRGGSKGGHAGAESYSSSKVSTRVRVNAQDVLDLSIFCNPAGLSAAAAAGRPPPRYELVAVADHTGVIHGGHYTARGRCVLDGSWAEFNDSLVLAADPPSGSSSAAYMMLYRLLGR